MKTIRGDTHESFKLGICSSILNLKPNKYFDIYFVISLYFRADGFKIRFSIMGNSIENNLIIQLFAYFPISWITRYNLLCAYLFYIFRAAFFGIAIIRFEFSIIQTNSFLCVNRLILVNI